MWKKSVSQKLFEGSGLLGIPNPFLFAARPRRSELYGYTYTLNHESVRP